MPIARRLAVFANLASQIYYHGSEHQQIDWRDKYFYLSPHVQVATQYARGGVFKPGQFHGERAGFIHSFKLNLSEREIFNPNNENMREELLAIVKRRNKQLIDPDDFINPRDMIQHTASGRLALSYAYMADLVPILQDLHYKAAVVGEGSQDWSLNVFNPRRDLQLIRVQPA